MKKFTVLLLWLLVITPSAWAQSSHDYSAVDRFALLAPSRVEGDVKSLARYLSGNCSPHSVEFRVVQTDEDKARAIYRWVTDRIAYDVPAYLNDTDLDISPEATLWRRKSVCAGYALLYEALGHEAGLNVVYCEGQARLPYDDDPGGHAWNAVQINGRWWMVDACWGAGCVDHNRFCKWLDNDWFATPPERFLLSHFPEEPDRESLSYYSDTTALIGDTRKVKLAGPGHPCYRFLKTFDKKRLAGIKQWFLGAGRRGDNGKH